MPTASDPSQQTPRGLLERLSQLFHDNDLSDRDTLLETLHEAREGGVIDEETFLMMEGALTVSERRAVDLMIPRAKFDAVDLSEPRSEWLPRLIASGRSRVPVYQDDMDNVLGILHAKDLLGLIDNPGLDVASVLRPARFIPESQPSNVLLRDFKSTRTHMALVVDEYGSVSGLITIEDVIEQIVGEIDDEFDEDDEKDNIVPDGSGWRVKAQTNLKQFNEYFDADLEDDFVETIGGLVMDRFEHVPREGEEISEKGFRFRILRSDARQVALVRVERVPL